MDKDESKKRGRPRVIRTEDELAEIRRRRNAASKSSHQKTGWSAQKKYKSQHRAERYEVKVTMPAENREAFAQLLKDTNLTIADLLLGALYDQYHIDFRKPLK